MTSTDLIVPGDDSPYTVLAMPQDELTDLIQSNLSAGDSISIGDLTRVKTPGGGGTIWEVPDLTAEDGIRADKELRGVIIKKGKGRTYFASAYEDSDGSPPECSSRDGLTGEGEPGGACALCPLNAFGPNGESKPCAEYMRLFILPQGRLLPMVLDVKPGSLKLARKYFNTLLDVGLKPHYVETVLTLKKARSEKRNVDYAEIQFRLGTKLSPEARAQVAAYAEMIAPNLERASREAMDGAPQTGEAEAA